MAMQYINQIKAKAQSTRFQNKNKNKTSPPPSAPVLTKEDENFLRRITSNPEEARQDGGESAGDTGEEKGKEQIGKDPQLALMDGAQDIPLPISPPEEAGEESGGLRADDKGVKGGEEKAKAKNRNPWSWIKKDKKKSVQEPEATGESATDKKAPDVTAEKAEDLDDKEVKEEEEDLSHVLEGLNLAAVNNRAFSVSDETQELLQKFKVIFGDLVRGVPTAYDDLESLLTNGDKQLQKSYNHLPGFLQKLVEQLPDKVTEKLGPEIAAATAEKAASSDATMEGAGKAASAAKKMGLKTPSLKDLVGKPGAIAGMLRSIISFLQARFPAIVGVNVLWSLALFILLFVLWYCHKRGREVRLEKERLLTEQEVAQLEAEYESSMGLDGLTTTAPEGATIDAVEAGVREVQQAREDQWKEEKNDKNKKIEAYPGT